MLITKPMLSLYCPVPIHQDQGGLGTCLLKGSPPRILKSRSMAISGEIRKTYALHRNDFTTYDDEWAHLKMELIFKNNTFSVICLILTILITNLIYLMNMGLQNFEYINPLKREVFPPKRAYYDPVYFISPESHPFFKQDQIKIPSAYDIFW